VSAARLLAGLRCRGVQVQAAGGRLSVDAPRGKLAAGDRAALRERKAEVLDVLADAKSLGADGGALWLHQIRQSLTPVGRERLLGEAEGGDRLALLIVTVLDVQRADG
jgi:hypothetical protein